MMTKQPACYTAGSFGCRQKPQRENSTAGAFMAAAPLTLYILALFSSSNSSSEIQEDSGLQFSSTSCIVLSCLNEPG